MQMDKFLEDLAQFINNHPYFDAYARDDKFKAPKYSNGDVWDMEISTPDEEYEAVKIRVIGIA